MAKAPASSVVNPTTDICLVQLYEFNRDHNHHQTCLWRQSNDKHEMSYRNSYMDPSDSLLALRVMQTMSFDRCTSACHLRSRYQWHDDRLCSSFLGLELWPYKDRHNHCLHTSVSRRSADPDLVSKPTNSFSHANDRRQRCHISVPRRKNHRIHDGRIWLWFRIHGDRDLDNNSDILVY